MLPSDLEEAYSFSRIAELSIALGSFLKSRVDVHGFLTPPAAQGLSAHYDAASATAEQYELDRKALESLPPTSDTSPASTGDPEVRVALPANAVATPMATPFPTYTVVGLEAGDTLNVRSGAGVNNPVVARLPISYSGVEVTGTAVSNGTTVWVPIKIGNIQGWVVRKNLYP